MWICLERRGWHWARLLWGAADADGQNAGAGEEQRVPKARTSLLDQALQLRREGSLKHPHPRWGLTLTFSPGFVNSVEGCRREAQPPQGKLVLLMKGRGCGATICLPDSRAEPSAWWQAVKVAFMSP